MGTLAQLRFRACYCSILDQCWFSDLRGLAAQPVRGCPVPPHPYRAFEGTG